MKKDKTHESAPLTQFQEKLIDKLHKGSETKFDCIII